MESALTRKEQFFLKGIEAISNFKSAAQEQYICPICEGSFGRNDLSDGKLTFEHVPQEFRKGRALILTCKNCNSSAGHTLDAEAFAREQMVRFGASLVREDIEYDGLVKLFAGGETVNVRLSVRENINRLELLPKNNHPKAAERLNEFFENLARDGKGDGEKFRITPLVRSNFWLSKVSDLRTAFLIAFALLGYRYALDDRLSLVRQQIRKPKDKIIKGFWSAAEFDKPEQNLILLLHEPVVALCIQFGRSFVILPWLDGPRDPYSVLEASYQPNQPINFRGRPFRWPEGPEFLLDLSSPQATSFA